MTRDRILIAAIGVVTVGLIALAIPQPESAHSAPGSIAVQPTAREVEVCLTRAGVNPRAMAAVGVSAASVPSIVNAAHVFLTEHATELAAIDTSIAAARSARDTLERTIRAGRATEGAVAELAAARASLASAADSRNSLLADARTESLDGLASGLPDEFTGSASTNCFPFSENGKQSVVDHVADGRKNTPGEQSSTGGFRGHGVVRSSAGKPAGRAPVAAARAGAAITRRSSGRWPPAPRGPGPATR